MLQNTMKAFYYNFLPIKSEEEECKFQNKPWYPTRYVVELRNMSNDLGLEIDQVDPWVIKRIITNQDISSGSLYLSTTETFDHIFKYWPLDLANSVALGSVRMPVAMWNFTEDDHPNMYMGPDTYLQKGEDDYSYLLKWVEMASEPWVDPGDELGLYWDTKLDAFQVFLEELRSIGVEELKTHFWSILELKKTKSQINVMAAPAASV